MGFINKSDKNGVLVRDDEGNDDEIEAYMVFDCTGERREVIKAVNQLYPNYFQINPVVHEFRVPIKKHFLAYVKMSDGHTTIPRIIAANPSAHLFKDNLAKFEQLRKMGWEHFSIPDFYSSPPYGKSKRCFYMEHPDNLPENLYESWFKTLLSIYSEKHNINYEYCDAPKKVVKKPRLQAFTIFPKELSPLFHSGSNQLPIVMAQGDAQIGFNHRLANGVRNGLERVETLNFPRLTVHLV